MTMIHEHEVKTEHDDTLGCGVMRINEDEIAVAYASLGKTTATIYRAKDGKVRIEIDDVAEEPVYVSINTMTATASEDKRSPLPWDASEVSNRLLKQVQALERWNPATVGIWGVGGVLHPLRRRELWPVPLTRMRLWIRRGEFRIFHVSSFDLVD